METWREELYHFQRLGAKWGKKNGPPYPLSKNQLSSVQKKLDSKNNFSKNSENTHTEGKLIPIPIPNLIPNPNPTPTPNSNPNPTPTPDPNPNPTPTPDPKTNSIDTAKMKAIIDETSKAIGNIGAAKSAFDRAKRAGKPKQDLSHLTDEEMSEFVKRINLEEAYRKAVAVPDTKAEKRKAIAEGITKTALAVYGGIVIADKLGIIEKIKRS